MKETAKAATSETPCLLCVCMYYHLSKSFCELCEFSSQFATSHRAVIILSLYLFLFVSCPSHAYILSHHYARLVFLPAIIYSVSCSLTFKFCLWFHIVLVSCSFLWPFFRFLGCNVQNLNFQYPNLRQCFSGVTVTSAITPHESESDHEGCGTCRSSARCYCVISTLLSSNYNVLQRWNER